MSAENIEFLLDLDAKVDGADRMLDFIDNSGRGFKELDAAAQKVTKSIERVDKAGGRAAASHEKQAHSAINLGHAFEGAKDRAHSLLEAMGLMLVFEGVEKITEKVFELGGEILNAAAKAERAELSFKLLLGDEEGGELLEYVEGIAKYTEFTDDELKGVVQGLLKAGFAAKEIPRALAGGLDIAAFSGNAQEGLNEALGALERIKRTGRVDNRVLAGLGFGEKDFLKELSKRTGVGTETLKKQLEKGKVDVNKSLESLYSMIHKRTGKDLGGAAFDMSQTLGARLRHLMDIPDQMFQGLASTDSYHLLSDAFGRLLEDLSPEGPIGKRLASALGRVFTGVAEFVADVDWNTAFDALVDSLQQAYDIASSLASVMKDSLEAVTKVTDALGITSDAEATNRDLNNDPAVIAADAKMRDTQRRLRELRKARQGADGQNPFYMAIKAAELARVPHDAGYYIGEKSAEGMVKGLKHGAPEVKGAGAEVGSSAVEGAAGPDGVDAHSPSRLFEHLGRMSSEGYVKGLEQTTGRLDAAVGAALAADAPAGAPAGRGGSGTPPINVHVEVHVAGHAGGVEAGEKLGEQVADAVEQILPGALQSAFQRMQQEAGT
jgi:hypothetical protein